MEVQYFIIDENSHDQRLDNYLIKQLKSVPRSHLYQIVRSGQVRVNAHRVRVTYRLQCGDRVRVPPIRYRVSTPAVTKASKEVSYTALYEDDDYVVLNKPIGVAVHGGSGIREGLIESFRETLPQNAYRELVHRLDRETSGILVLAKRRRSLVAMQKQLRDGQIKKFYHALVKGRFGKVPVGIDFSLHTRVLGGGEKRTRVDRVNGKSSLTTVCEKELLGENSFLKLRLVTGRTHQIRVHLAHSGYPIIGDERYGCPIANKRFATMGMRRMFLHASKLVWQHALTGQRIEVIAPLPEALSQCLEQFRSEQKKT